MLSSLPEGHGFRCQNEGFFVLSGPLVHVGKLDTSFYAVFISVDGCQEALFRSGLLSQGEIAPSQLQQRGRVWFRDFSSQELEIFDRKSLQPTAGELGAQFIDKERKVADKVGRVAVSGIKPT